MHNLLMVTVFIIGVLMNLAFTRFVLTRPELTLVNAVFFTMITATVLSFDTAILYGIFNEFKEAINEDKQRAELGWWKKVALKKLQKEI